jgi:hypothetical protein
MPVKTSGQGGFVFTYREDLRALPAAALPCEVNLHGGFAVDKKPAGSIYYGMPACGIMRISADLTMQDIIELPAKLKPLSFHSTKICEFDGKRRLVMPAAGDALVAVLDMEGKLDFVLPKPEFEAYQKESAVFRPTDTAAVGRNLYVADGYGENYISKADMAERKWTQIFAGKTADPNEPGKFGTAHGLNRAPDGQHLAIADRPHSRFESFTLEGKFESAHAIPPGSRPCGIDFFKRGSKWYALVGSLDDPQQGRAAPIYILDAETYAVVSTIRPKEELGVALADHIHNTVWYEQGGHSYLICQAWNPGFYFVLELTT